VIDFLLNFSPEMKVGFQLNGSSKRKKIVDDNNGDDADKREKIVQIEGNILQTDLAQKQATLVIPLPPPRNLALSTPNQISSEKSEKDQSNLDDLAAQEILADLKGPADTGSNLVIDAVKSKGEPNAPLLLANVAPELMSITNDDERFKVDVSLRAENLDVNSDIYQSIPIAEFGAAMLRGMGWAGPSPEEEKDDKKYQVVPRESRLGLGATPKPPEEKKKSLHPDRFKSSATQEKKKEGWKKKAEEHLEKQKLYVRAYPACCFPRTLSSSVGVGGRCGVVNRPCGVGWDSCHYCPNQRSSWIGQSKVRRLQFPSPLCVASSPDRVSLEKDGSDRIVDKRDVVLVTDDELKEKPFKRIFLSPESLSSTLGRNGSDKDRDSRQPQGSSKSNKRDRDEEHERDTLKKHKSDRREKNERQTSSKSSGATADRGGENNGSPSWLQTGIRVKIVSKKINDHDRHYLSKGTIIDVYYPSSKSSRDRSSSSSAAAKVASLRLDSGVVLQDVKEKYLETVLPKNVGESCLILTGEHRGLSGTLIEKDYERNEVTVQLVEEMEIVLLSMDSVAALA
jgi:G patch domain and KOW motifs-containing protein